MAGCGSSMTLCSQREHFISCISTANMMSMSVTDRDRQESIGVCMASDITQVLSPHSAASGRSPVIWHRILVAVLIGILSTTLCGLFLARMQVGGADFGWPLRAARDLLAGRDPYDYPF